MSKLPTADILLKLKEQLDCVGTKLNGLTWQRIDTAMQEHTRLHTEALREDNDYWRARALAAEKLIDIEPSDSKTYDKYCKLRY